MQDIAFGDRLGARGALLRGSWDLISRLYRVLGF